ncbi:MAG TPA: hypothetical protein VFH51_11490, partial [Myxococcota bacterium]|nr:hypothetical protein [Myxococcota bacterium]
RCAGRLPSAASQARAQAATAELARLRREEAQIPAPVPVETAASMRWALRVLVQESLFASFAHAVASDASLTAFFSGDGVTAGGGRSTVDAGAMDRALARLAGADQSPPAPVMARFWTYAERAVLRDRKAAHEHRVRELLDVLALRLHLSARSDSRSGGRCRGGGRLSEFEAQPRRLERLDQQALLER